MGYELNHDWRAMNGRDHYGEAERLLEEAESSKKPVLGQYGPSSSRWSLKFAKVHTAPAQVAATALNSDGREWVEVAGRRFSKMA